jgi:diacylglycerol kinase (ATP)
MSTESTRRILVLANPRSGLRWSFTHFRRAMDAAWDLPGNEVAYQFSQSIEDSVAKVRRAVERGVDTILVVGGDGTVNSVGRELIGTPVTLGIIPTGSGNGFARHFGTPLSPPRAVAALARGEVRSIDVGVVGESPFLVTCSMAWEAAIADAFEKAPIRGILPYIFAGMQELFEYDPQDFKVTLDSKKTIELARPLLFTIANLSQYGGGAKIAPQARADDGYLELVVARRQDIAKLIANVGRLFDGSIQRLPEVVSHRFQVMQVQRDHHAPIQIDGELVDAPADIRVGILPDKLKVLVPQQRLRRIPKGLLRRAKGS